MDFPALWKRGSRRKKIRKRIIVNPLNISGEGDLLEKKWRLGFGKSLKGCTFAVLSQWGEELKSRAGFCGIKKFLKKFCRDKKRFYLCTPKRRERGKEGGKREAESGGLIATSSLRWDKVH
ncbi:MAG: hypothetical protein LRY55_11110 [Leadbetterella sp.]|nr:hypothetical protein [Leadbetterella sp.]